MTDHCQNSCYLAGRCQCALTEWCSVCGALEGQTHLLACPRHPRYSSPSATTTDEPASRPADAKGHPKP